MIISRTPLRISLGGGGTDLPSYYRHSEGGFLVAGAINSYIYIAVNDNFDGDILLKYSQNERVERIDEVRHPLLRECLRLTGVDRAVEISSMADIPAHTGLGSSGSFTVGVLKALRAYKRHLTSNFELAQEACHIEIDTLGEPVGKQDQFIAAIGGITAFEFRPDDTVDVKHVPLDDEAREGLEENLLLFFTGIKRPASSVLAEHDRRTRSDPGSVAKNLNEVKRIGRQSFEALSVGDLKWFAELMSEQWELKMERSSDSADREVDAWIKAGLEAGAVGGKLVGAGGGGFLLFYVEEKSDIRAKMGQLGLREVRFGFDYEGSKLEVT